MLLVDVPGGDPLDLRLQVGPCASPLGFIGDIDAYVEWGRYELGYGLYLFLK